jgi:cell wall-associated NlpC family hydrolase
MADELLRPDPQDLQTGDLLWVKRDDQVIIFNDPLAQELLTQELQQAKAQALAQDGWSATQREAIAQWQPDASHADIWVGHIAIVDVRDSVPWVIDATPSRHQPATHASYPPGLPKPSNAKGVADQTYAAWLQDSGHVASHVWQARVKYASKAQAQGIADYARSQIGKPYRFVPWFFGNAHKFYCSELVWCAVKAATGIALDDDDSRLRVFWYTPVMALRSLHLDVRYAPKGRAYSLQDKPINV